MIVGTTRSENIPADQRAKGNNPNFVPMTPPGEVPFGLVKRSNDALIEQGKDTSNLHLILDMSRVGGNLFSVRMEYTYFAPRSGQNKYFNMVLMKWPRNGMMWAILSFPIEYRPQAEIVAQECGLKIANGVPHVFDMDGAHTFPLDGETVFTLENIHNHKVYDNDPETQKRLKDEEFAAVNAILSADLEKLYQEFRDKGYTDEQTKRILAHWKNGNEEYDEPPAAVKDGQHRHGPPEKIK